MAYLIIVAINWRDREPSATAIEFAKNYAARPTLAEADNAFVYLLGFSVAPDESPADMGSKRLAWLSTTSEGTPLDSTADPLGERSDSRDKRPPVVQGFLNACADRERGCAAALENSNEVLEQWLASEGWLLTRYRALIAHADWQELIHRDIAAPIPSYGLVMDGQKLLLLKAKSAAEQGDYAGARHLLEKDLRFWRMVLESSDTILSKMIATAAINRHFELGSLMLRNLQRGSAAAVLPVSWSTAISNSERSMRRALIGEWIFSSELMRSLSVGGLIERDLSLVDRMSAWLTEPLYQPQDTFNKMADNHAQLAESMDVPLTDLAEAMNRSEARARQRAEHAFPPRSAYNIIGNLLVGMSGSVMTPYAARVGDIEGVRRAALAAVTLRDANVVEPEIAAALAASVLRNPYTDSPFMWAEQDGAIVFRGLEAGLRGEHRIHY